MSTFSINDGQNMSLALKLAKMGRYAVKSNPMVGSVITKDNQIIATGYHQKYGSMHAEIDALDKINYKANGLTMYVSLEPCSFTGKTGACTQAIIKAGVKKIIIATLDPNPKVNGKGAKILKKAGLEVKVGLLENKAKEINRGFIKRMQTGKPFVTCKIAMSLDGKTSMLSGESKWITGKPARLDVHKLRASSDAIITGSGTVLADNPTLNVRLDNIKATPLRVIVDSKNQITNKNYNIFSNDAKTIVLNKNNTKTLKSGKLDLNDALIKIGEKDVNNLLLEAGPGLVGAMIEAKLIDEFIIYTAPILMGSSANSMAKMQINNMTDRIKLNIKDIRALGDDIKIIAKIL